ncbi:MAG: ring-cleaving dioxygenase [Thermomicrobiales bacterium]|nr:ring-cleaving dioxygenase [Thermomicrobiales bacterium]
MMPTTPLTGIHHISAMTGDAQANVDFYTRLLGMRAVKKTVNQDSVDVYHLFYADGEGQAGTDLTFFAFRGIARNRAGAGEINQIVLRVPTNASIDYWVQRFDRFGVSTGTESRLNGHRLLPFEDFEGQRLALMADEGGDVSIVPGTPWEHSTVPVEHQIIGLGAVSITTGRPENTLRMLTEIMGFTVIADEQGPEHPDHRILLLRIHTGGPNGLMIVHVRPDLPLARNGAGGVHHVSFRTPSQEAFTAWNRYLTEMGVRVTPEIDRYYFKAMYFREPGGVLYEISTDGPGFATDESQETMGQQLALPPAFAPMRDEIEPMLMPLDTSFARVTTEYGEPV